MMVNIYFFISLCSNQITETGPLPDKYKLQEIPIDNFSECIEQNVKDSKGTLILSYGRLTGDLDYARRMTLKHRRQLLGIDLNHTIPFKAAYLVHDWIQLRYIDVLFCNNRKAMGKIKRNP